jgi:transcriptional regulator with XRE-family HTH domain
MVSAKFGKGDNKGDGGRLLRAARRRRGLTLEEVAVNLHMPTTKLKALEEGDISVFQAEVYARGAYFKYARYLGVEAEVDRQALNRTIARAREVVPLRLPLPRVWWEKWLTPRGLFLVGLLLATLVGGSYVGVQVQSFLRLPALKIVEPRERIIRAEAVRLRGIAEEGALVTINELPVLLAPDGSFELEFWLHPGVNILRVEASGAAGRSRVIEYDLLRPRS